MNARLLRTLAAVASVCVFVSASASAEPQNAPAAPAQTGPGAGAEEKSPYGEWWLLHAREVNPRPTGWLFHAEGGGSFANSTGSMSGYQVVLNGLSALRKGIVTNQFGASFQLDDQRIEDGRGSFKQKTIRLFDMLLINVAKPLDLVTAAIYEKDEPKRVLHRFSTFAGPSRSISLGKGRVLGLAGALGFEKEEFATMGPEPSIEQNPIAYLQNTFSTPIARRGMLKHHVEAFFDLEDTEDVRVNWNLGLNLQLTPRVGIGPSLQVRYDARPVTQVQSTDTMLTIGVQVR